MNEAKKLLKEFRKASNDLDWPHYWMLGGQLLSHIDVNDAIHIAEQELSEYLPTYEDYYPDDTWSRKLLTHFREHPKSQWHYEYPLFKGSKYDSNNSGYHNALILLQDGARYADRPNISYPLLWSAICSALSIKTIEYWISTYPDDWQIEYDDDGNLSSEKEQIRLEFPQDIQDYKKSLYLKVVDQIEENL